jgi:hypothetical protein
MRKNSTIHLATSATQYVRVAGGQIWANPEFATSAYGFLGTTIANVLPNTNGNFPFGTGYSWQSTSTYTPAVDENQKQPYALRFSGFNIDDVGILGSYEVTNLYVVIEYSDTSIVPGYSAIQELNTSGSNWLITVTKPNGTKLYKRRFDGLASSTIISTRVTIPCMKDQNWGTNTFGSSIAPNSVSKAQKSVSASKDLYTHGPFTGYGYKTEYYESTNDIKPLIIDEINSSGFIVDLWYSKFGGVSGLITVKSVGIYVEYVETSNKSATLWPLNVAPDVPKTIYIPEFNSVHWTNPSVAGIPDSLDSENGSDINIYDTESYPGYISISGSKAIHDTYVDIFARPSPGIHNIMDPFGGFDTDILLAKLPGLSDIDDSTSSISDLIIDVRVNGKSIELNSYGPPRVKWTYTLMDGYPLDKRGNTTNGTPIWQYAMQAIEPGIKLADNLPGQDWPHFTGTYNKTDREYYGSEDNWYMKHFPIIRNTSYVWEITNNTTYPGLSYDPLWIEKAIKAGRLYVGIIFTVNPGVATYYNMIPHPVWWLRVDSLGIRIKYNDGIISASEENSLLYRNVP